MMLLLKTSNITNLLQSQEWSNYGKQREKYGPGDN